MLLNGNKNILKQESNKHLEKSTSLRKDTRTDDSDNHLLNHAMNYIEQLNEMRFIEKISRPIQKRIKEQYVEKFAGRMENLHNILERIKRQLNFKPEKEIYDKSIAGSTTHQQTTFKTSIKKIESRYIEVFKEGSFKYYKKLYQLNGFNYTLDPVDIQQWSIACLSHELKNRKSCC